MIQARTNGPMTELIEADENNTPAHLIDEFMQYEKRRIKSCSIKRREVQLPGDLPEPVKKEFRQLKRENEMLRNAMHHTVTRVEDVANKSYQDHLTQIRLNSTNVTLGLLCRNFAHNIPSITVFFNDGSLGTFRCEKEGQPEQIEQPKWVDMYDIYKHKRAVQNEQKNGLQNKDQNRGRPYNPNYRRFNAWGGRNHNNYSS